MAVLQFAKDPNTQTLKLVVVLVAGALLGALASDFASNRPLFLLQGSQCAHLQLKEDVKAAANTTEPARGECLVQMLAPPHTRDGLGYLLEAEGLKAGAELGVQRGQFARLTLDRWPSCTQYILVDVWKQQENYVEGANVDNNQQEEIYQAAIAAVEPHKAKVKVMRMFTNEAALQVAIESLDYVYVDARHDYCGCLEDMEMWWPKLKPGAIMAGHDYLNVAEQKEVTPDEDWGICMDGSRNEGAVKGAVANFAQRYGLTVAVTYAEGHPFRTWLLRKPKC